MTHAEKEDRDNLSSEQQNNLKPIYQIIKKLTNAQAQIWKAKSSIT
jgi:hypothetical protein